MSDLYPGPAPMIDPPLEEREAPLMGNNPILSRTSSRRGRSGAGGLSGPVAWTAGALLALAAIGVGASYWVSHERQPSLFASTSAPSAASQPAAPPAPAMAPDTAPSAAPAPVVAQASEVAVQPSSLARNEHRAAARGESARARAAEETGADVSAVAPPVVSSPPTITPPPAAASSDAPVVVTPPPPAAPS
jgi:hypothetical protein